RRISDSTYFLVNPASDNGATGKRWPELAHRAARLGLTGETFFSERPGHLIELARQAVDAGASLVVAVGGDGTLNEVVNGIAQRANGMSKALGGKATFFYALTRVFFEWENTEVTVQLDGGERRGRMHDVVVANGVWHGGGMKLAPDARPDDGLFDVVLIGDV